VPQGRGDRVAVAGFPPQLPRDVWFEGDHVLFVATADEGGAPRLLRLPLSGGVPEAVATCSLCARDGVAGPFALTSDRWLAVRASDAAGIAVLAHDRATHAEATLGPTLPVSPVEAVFVAAIPSGAWLFLAGPQPYAVPLAGGAAAPVPALDDRPGGFLVASSHGTVLWHDERNEGDGALRTELALTKLGADAPPEKLSPRLPDGVLPTGAWDDGRGGFTVMTRETLSDGARHASVWSVRVGSPPARLACDPIADRYVELGDVAPDGLFFAATVEDLAYTTELVHVAAP
jgi:hypothetical protein